MVSKRLEEFLPMEESIHNLRKRGKSASFSWRDEYAQRRDPQARRRQIVLLLRRKLFHHRLRCRAPVAGPPRPTSTCTK